MPITQQMLPALLTANTHAGAELGKAGVEAALKAYLQKQEPAIAGQTEEAQNKADLSILKNPEAMAMIRNGGSVQVRGMHFGANPAVHNQQALMHGEAQAISQAQHQYNHEIPKLQTTLSAASEGLDAINDPNNKMSKGQLLGAATRALGLSRFPNREEAKQLLPPTLQAQASQFANWLGDDNNPLNESDRKAGSTFLKSIIDSQEQQHSTIKQNALNTALSSPYASPSTSNHLVSMGKPMEDMFAKIKTKYSRVPETSGPNLTATPNPGFLDNLKKMFSPKQQPTAATPAGMTTVSNPAAAPQQSQSQPPAPPIDPFTAMRQEARASRLQRQKQQFEQKDKQQQKSTQAPPPFGGQ